MGESREMIKGAETVRTPDSDRDQIVVTPNDQPVTCNRRHNDPRSTPHPMRDAKITQIYEGTNQVQRIVMARNLP